MNASTREVIELCAKSSKEGTAHFPDIVKALVAAGVESYWVDYRADATTYYCGDASTHQVELVPPPVAIAQDFDIESVRAAIRGAQSGRVMFPEFLRLTRVAGCVGYIAWLAGRHVVYYGRLGQTHVEKFPS
jgi:uncharacterized protein YbcV (DUF1398 family)